jgi:hypothetical protein
MAYNHAEYLANLAKDGAYIKPAVANPAPSSPAPTPVSAPANYSPAPYQPTYQPSYSAPTTYQPPAQNSYSAPTPYQSTYKGPDIAGMTDSLNKSVEARKASELDAIRRQRDTALQGYNGMETGTKQQAYDNRNQSDVVSMQNAQKLRQSMADMGLLSSGTNLTAQAQGNAQRQGAIGSINQNESNQLTDIGQKRTLLQNQAAGQEVALNQQLEADRLDRLMALQQYGDQANMNLDNMNYGRYQDTIGNQFQRDQLNYGQSQDNLNNQYRNNQLDWQKIIDASNQTGYFNGNSNWWNQGTPQAATPAPQPANTPTAQQNYDNWVNFGGGR